jgi:hypothetical protein
MPNVGNRSRRTLLGCHFASSLFQVGEDETREKKIWNSGTQEKKRQKILFSNLNAEPLEVLCILTFRGFYKRE